MTNDPADDWGSSRYESEPPDDPDSAADAVAIRRMARRASRRKAQARKFWQAVLADKTGRQEIWGLLQSAHTFEERFACGPNGFPQDYATWFHAGEQAFGLRLFMSLQAMDRDGVWKMLDEHDPRFAKPRRQSVTDKTETEENA